jgi:hypothetical protein
MKATKALKANTFHPYYWASTSDKRVVGDLGELVYQLWDD